MFLNLQMFSFRLSNIFGYFFTSFPSPYTHTPFLLADLAICVNFQ